jgi:nucleoside-diphosphate-sugar epimerase
MSAVTDSPVALVTGAAGFIGAHLTRALIEHARMPALLAAIDAVTVPQRDLRFFSRPVLRRLRRMRIESNQ